MVPIDFIKVLRTDAFVFISVCQSVGHTTIRNDNTGGFILTYWETAAQSAYIFVLVPDCQCSFSHLGF